MIYRGKKLSLHYGHPQQRVYKYTQEVCIQRIKRRNRIDFENCVHQIKYGIAFDNKSFLL